jgi:hypothetical protein
MLEHPALGCTRLEAMLAPERAPVSAITIHNRDGDPVPEGARKYLLRARNLSAEGLRQRDER